MITLFHRPKTRSSRFIFLLEELDAPYEVKLVTVRGADGGGALDPANPHPHGKVPAITHNGVTIFESAAIALYLTDAFPKNGVGPLVGDPKRGPYLTWLAYYCGVMEPAWTSKFMNMSPPRGTAGWVDTDEVMDWVVKTLNQGPFILGERFSAVDILIGTTFALFLGGPLLAKTPLLEGYVKRVLDRPAYQRAQARENG